MILKSMKRILVIDNNIPVLLKLKQRLEKAGYLVVDPSDQQNRIDDRNNRIGYNYHSGYNYTNNDYYSNHHHNTDNYNTRPISRSSNRCRVSRTEFYKPWIT